MTSKDLSFMNKPPLEADAGTVAQIVTLLRQQARLHEDAYGAPEMTVGELSSLMERAADLLVAPRGEAAEWYPCSCGAEHNTRECPFGYPSPAGVTDEDVSHHIADTGNMVETTSAPLSVEAREQAIRLVAEAATLRGKVALCSEKICPRCDVFRTKAAEADAEARALLNLPPTTGGQ